MYGNSAPLYFLILIYGIFLLAKFYYDKFKVFEYYTNWSLIGILCMEIFYIIKRIRLFYISGVAIAITLALLSLGLALGSAPLIYSYLNLFGGDYPMNIIIFVFVFEHFIPPIMLLIHNLRLADEQNSPSYTLFLIMLTLWPIIALLYVIINDPARVYNINIERISFFILAASSYMYFYLYLIIQIYGGDLTLLQFLRLQNYYQERQGL